MIEIVAPGPQATVQDLGRPGRAGLGVPSSGAFDRGSLALANRLVGNAPDAAAIETTFGGLAIRMADPATIALTGAVCAGAPDWGVALSLPAGTVIRLGTPARGVRSYLAVRGGVDVAPVLGSRSTDTLSGLGPPALRAGDRVQVGRPGEGRGSVRPGSVGESAAADAVGESAAANAVGESAAANAADEHSDVGGVDAVAEVSGAAAVPLRQPGALRLVPGPHDDLFPAVSRAALTGVGWTVRSDSDRVGVRLSGPPLERLTSGELPSEPTLPGALQVPPDGQPILFGPDAPVTGGYPVIGVLALADLDWAAQLRPGDAVRFQLVAPPFA